MSAILTWPGRSGRVQELEDSLRLLGEVASSVAQCSCRDRDEALQAITRLAVPAFADWCTVAISIEGDSGEFRRVAVRHCNDRRSGIAKRLLEVAPLTDKSATTLSRALESGRPVIDPIAAELLKSGSHRTGFGWILQHLGTRSLMEVPLLAGGDPIGILTLVYGESNRSYGPQSIPSAMVLGALFGVLLERPRIDVRDRALGNAAHDLKNPLSAILMNSMLIPRFLAQQKIEEAIGSCLTIRKTAEAMNRLITKLLEEAPHGLKARTPREKASRA